MPPKAGADSAKAADPKIDIFEAAKLAAGIGASRVQERRAHPWARQCDRPPVTV